MRDDAGELLDEIRRLKEQLASVEQRHANLASLYVASHRLHASTDRSEVLTVILEIVVNIIGSEEVAVLERPDGEPDAPLAVTRSFGLHDSVLASLGAKGGLVDAAVSRGQTLIPSRDGRGGALEHESELTACVPLTFARDVFGAVTFFRLLPQKPSLSTLDHELLDALAVHGSSALYCARVHERTARHEGGDARV